MLREQSTHSDTVSDTLFETVSNKELFYNLPIGIPPYQEQQRIAKRIDELSQLLK